MGAKDSKPSFITYEDAVKRVSDNELRRIREAFKRCAGSNGTALSLEAFVHDVLCDGVPYEVADWLYQACGGTKRGIAFRELLCGIVVLTKGNIEEKIKFLWTLYTNNQPDGTYIYKRDFARTLHLENTSLPVTGAQRSSEILLGLFGCGDKVTYDQFRSWLLIHKDATVLSKWLLSEVNMVQELETPTFYQSLAGVTHLEERDIIELEKCFWSLRNNASTGELDFESMSALLSPPLPAAAVAGAFLAFDENRDGHVDFKELCCGLSAACRGPKTERLKFIFKMFDVDSDGVLNSKEVSDMVSILCEVGNEHARTSRSSTPDVEPEFSPNTVHQHLAEKLGPAPASRVAFNIGHDDDQTLPDEPRTDPVLTLEDFLIWSVESAELLMAPFLELVFEVCHVALGLRPQCRHHERDIVLGWLRRAVCRGYSVGQFWYLVSGEWWCAWAAYTAAPAPAPCACRPHHVPDDAIVCDDSFTTNSTESMGSLVWRCETASVGSGSSSGVSSASPRTGPAPPPPGPVDNRALLERGGPPVPPHVRALTGEGGALRRDVPLAQHRDFELLPDALWRAVANWHGALDPLPRQVIRPPNSDVELELYPLQLKLYRHVPSVQSINVGPSTVGGVYSAVPAPPERQLAYTAAFSRLATVRQVLEFICGALGLAREEVRLWVLGSSTVLLDDDSPTLSEIHLQHSARLLLETRNADQTWPEEIGALARGAGERRETLVPPHLPGATGLHNLGNTCYMNAALQAVWNTGPLTRYFNSGMHLYEVNTTNPLGTKGALALRYGELCKEVWSCRARSVAPLRVRWAVSRWARALGGGGQHDAQELLAWLLDTLHEDLNRAPPAPSPALGAPAPAPGDAPAAAAAWAAHLARAQSIVTELFCGQLKSRVRCHACSQESVRFDVFNMLSLPLPMDADIRVNVRVILLDGSVPIKYGVKVPSEGTYLDLKKKLSELCNLPPERMLMVELSGAVFGRVFSDCARVCSPAELLAYETPGHSAMLASQPLTQQGPAEMGCGGVNGFRGEVSGAPNTSSLCMPALFCFKKSRSELAMSHSPPAALLKHSMHNDGEIRFNTLPKELKKDVKSSPTLSVKSLTLRPSSPMLGRRESTQPTDVTDSPLPTYLVAVHRKQVRLDAYFLPWQRSVPALFGSPLLVGVRGGMSGRALYAAVWRQLARLLSAKPPPLPANHATDCDDSLGYTFPFTLRVVCGAGGAWCGVCAWPALCRGCALPATTATLIVDTGGNAQDKSTHEWCSAEEMSTPDTDSPIAKAKLQRQASERIARNIEGTTSEGTLSQLDLSKLCGGGGGGRRGGRGVMLAIDWDPTALHLRYQTTREKAVVEHRSVGVLCGEARAGVDLASCLRAFTAPEALEQRYACAACRTAQPATKTLQLWRAPPILIIHLKRFQYVNNKWIKSQKVVNFPYEDFDPTEFLASLPQETILRHKEIIANLQRRASTFVDEVITESETEDETEQQSETTHEKRSRRRKKSIDEKRRQRLESTSLMATPVTDDNLVDYHQHLLLPDQDVFDLKYRLYAVVSHSGQLSGGHYVAYARNPCGSWLCYNDSSCREVGAAPALDPAAAYLLFYERRGLNYDAYLPDITGKQPKVNDATLPAEDQDINKMCVIS